MKIRNDFVTNSSSSSYVVIFKVDQNQELMDFLADEYGRFGTKIAEKYLKKGSDLGKWEKEEAIQFLGDQFDPDTIYLYTHYISETNEGAVDGESAFLK